MSTNFCSALSEKYVSYGPVFGALGSSGVVDRAHGEGVWPFLGGSQKWAVKQVHHGEKQQMHQSIKVKGVNYILKADTYDATHTTEGYLYRNQTWICVKISRGFKKTCQADK